VPHGMALDEGPDAPRFAFCREATLSMEDAGPAIDEFLNSRPCAAWSGARVAGLPATVCSALWAQAEQPLLSRLTPHQRVRVMAALAVVVLLGLGLVLFAWWGARAVRRHYWRSCDARQTGRRPGLREDDWATKPLVSDHGGQPDAAD
jgi:hypothetical protein